LPISEGLVTGVVQVYENIGMKQLDLPEQPVDGNVARAEKYIQDILQKINHDKRQKNYIFLRLAYSVLEDQHARLLTKFLNYLKVHPSKLMDSHYFAGRNDFELSPFLFKIMPDLFVSLLDKSSDHLENAAEIWVRDRQFHDKVAFRQARAASLYLLLHKIRGAQDDKKAAMEYGARAHDLVWDCRNYQDQQQVLKICSELKKAFPEFNDYTKDQSNFFVSKQKVSA